MATSELKNNIGNLDFVEELDSIKKFDKFLKLSAFYSTSDVKMRIAQIVYSL